MKRTLQMMAMILPLALPAQAGKLAIVIDDIGYRQKEDAAIYRLPKTVNVAIIPSAPYASARAKQAFEQQRDILIHLPMQPKGANVAIEAGALRIGMNADQVANLVTAARGAVPYAIGLNNHMGSGATSDKTTMQHLMQSLNQQQLFFLDSKTIGSSVAYQTAKEFGVKALERDVFLDASDELRDVQHQFEAAVRTARKNGVAVMIGHPRKNSIAVLEQGLATLPSDIQLVSIGSLWRNEQITPSSPFILHFAEANSATPPFEAVPLLRGVPQE